MTWGNWCLVLPLMVASSGAPSHTGSPDDRALEVDSPSHLAKRPLKTAESLRIAVLGFYISDGEHVGHVCQEKRKNTEVFRGGCLRLIGCPARKGSPCMEWSDQALAQIPPGGVSSGSLVVLVGLMSRFPDNGDVYLHGIERLVVVESAGHVAPSREPKLR